MKSKKHRLDPEIRKIAASITNLASKALVNCSCEANAIITSHSKDKRHIETVLDGMLDFCWDKNVLDVYKKLCRYYYDIDQRATAGYAYAYRDMWDPTSTKKNLETSKWDCL